VQVPELVGREPVELQLEQVGLRQAGEPGHLQQERVPEHHQKARVHRQEDRLRLCRWLRTPALPLQGKDNKISPLFKLWTFGSR